MQEAPVPGQGIKQTEPSGMRRITAAALHKVTGGTGTGVRAETLGSNCRTEESTQLRQHGENPTGVIGGKEGFSRLDTVGEGELSKQAKTMVNRWYLRMTQKFR